MSHGKLGQARRVVAGRLYRRQHQLAALRWVDPSKGEVIRQLPDNLRLRRLRSIDHLQISRAPLAAA